MIIDADYFQGVVLADTLYGTVKLQNLTRLEIAGIAFLGDGVVQWNVAWEQDGCALFAGLLAGSADGRRDTIDFLVGGGHHQDFRGHAFGIRT